MVICTTGSDIAGTAAIITCRGNEKRQHLMSTCGTLPLWSDPDSDFVKTRCGMRLQQMGVCFVHGHLQLVRLTLDQGSLGLNK